jgi:hypothetical protein
LFRSVRACHWQDLGHLPAGEFEARVESELQRWQQQYERSLIDRQFDSSGELRAVLEVDDTLVGLQEGLMRDVVVVRGIEEQVSNARTAAGPIAPTVPFVPPAAALGS